MILLSYLQIYKRLPLTLPLGGIYHDTQGIAIIERGILSIKYCFKAGKHTSILKSGMFRNNLYYPVKEILYRASVVVPIVRVLFFLLSVRFSSSNFGHTYCVCLGQHVEAFSGIFTFKKTLCKMLFFFYHLCDIFFLVPTRKIISFVDRKYRKKKY